MIGVGNATGMMGGGPNRLKRELLFFDKIVLVSANSAIMEWRAFGKQKYFDWADDLEFLINTDAFEADDEYKKILPSRDLDPRLAEYANMCQQEREIQEELKSLGKPGGVLGGKSYWETEVNQILEIHRLLVGLHARISAAYHAMTNGNSAYSIEPMPSISPVPLRTVDQGAVLELCISEVPMPNDQTPWQDIFAMKEDVDFAARARKIRLWTRDVASQGLTAEQAGEYLKDQLFEYENYMKLHTKKISSGTLSSVLVGSAAIVENLLKLRFTKIAKGLVDVRAAHNELLLAELKAPGREVSFISRIKDKVGKN